MAKESGKVHYLKNLPGAGSSAPAPSSAPYEDLIRRLENRIDRIEQDFRQGLQSLERSDLSSLIKGLEEKVQKRGPNSFFLSIVS